MKKLSVNGKRFKEIFQQRGTEVSSSDLKKGDFYVFYCPTFDITWVSQFSALDPYRIWRKASLSNNGRIYAEGFINRDECESIYSATENQIALLEAYRTNA